VRVWSLGSSSKGNAFVVEHGGCAVLVDAGFSARELARRVEAIGLEPHSISAVLITHEHEDHIRGVRRFAKRFGAQVFLNPRIRGYVLGDSDVDWAPLVCGESASAGGFRVHPFSIPHDATDPLGLRIEVDGASIAVCTDLGTVTPLVEYNLACSNVWLIEANHDPVMLRDGPYPWHLKQRIASAHGHLSNFTTADVIRRAAHDGLSGVMLVHLSETNNTPELARRTVSIALDDRPFDMTVAKPDEPVELLGL